MPMAVSQPSIKLMPPIETLIRPGNRYTQASRTNRQ